MNLEDRASTEAFRDEMVQTYSEIMDSITEAHDTGNTEKLDALEAEAGVVHDSIEAAEKALKNNKLPF